MHPPGAVAVGQMTNRNCHGKFPMLLRNPLINGITYLRITIWLFNIAMERSTIFNRLTIYFYGPWLNHGEVLNRQRLIFYEDVTCVIIEKSRRLP
jgi:hypothetical protein